MLAGVSQRANSKSERAATIWSGNETAQDLVHFGGIAKAVSDIEMLDDFGRYVLISLQVQFMGQVPPCRARGRLLGQVHYG